MASPQCGQKSDDLCELCRLCWRQAAHEALEVEDLITHRSVLGRDDGPAVARFQVAAEKVLS